MARIRSVHPELCTDETMANVSPRAERTFLRLWTHLDDEGRAKDNPKLIKAALYPLHDDVTAALVNEDLAELERNGLIVRYVVDGERFLTAKPETWRQYQKPRHPSPSKHPGPEEGSRVPPEDDGRPTAERRNAPAENGNLPDVYGGSSHGVVVGGGVGEGDGVLAGAVTARRRDELWETVLDVCGINSGDVTGTARGAINKALAELRGVNATPDEVRLRAAAWPTRYPDATLTPTALAKHWPQLDPARPPPGNGMKAPKGAGALHRAAARSGA